MAKTKASKLQEMQSAQQPQQEWGAQAARKSQKNETEVMEAEVEQLLADVEEDLKETGNKTLSTTDVEDAVTAGSDVSDSEEDARPGDPFWELQQMINKCKKSVAPKIDRSPPPKSLHRSISSNSDTYPASSSSDTAPLKGTKKQAKRKRDSAVKLSEHPNSIYDHPNSRIKKPEEEARLAKRRKGLVTSATAKAALKSAPKK
jgi:hypothetical protein